MHFKEIQQNRTLNIIKSSIFGIQKKKNTGYVKKWENITHNQNRNRPRNGRNDGIR